MHQRAIEFSIAIEDFGPNKISVVKELRILTSCSLQDAVRYITTKENFKEDLSKWDLELFKSRLERAGATIKITETAWEYL